MSKLDEVHALLDEFDGNLRAKLEIWENIRAANPLFEQASQAIWERHSGCWWILAGPDYIEARELEKRIYLSHTQSEIGMGNARQLVTCFKEDWDARLEECDYDLRSNFTFPEPNCGETVLSFVLRIAKLVESRTMRTRSEHQAFHSFLNYLRNQSSEQAAFLEHIFPRHMDQTEDGKIIRLIDLEDYPIPQEIAALTLMELTHICRYGRPNAHLTAAESLGYCWLCLTASRLRLPVTLKAIRGIKPSAICLDDHPTTMIPTLFGERPVRVSGWLCRYLQALSRIPSALPREAILQSHPRCLTRTLEKVVKKINVNPEFGPITYSSLLTPPHADFCPRYQPK